MRDLQPIEEEKHEKIMLKKVETELVQNGKQFELKEVLAHYDHKNSVVQSKDSELLQSAAPKSNQVAPIVDRAASVTRVESQIDDYSSKVRPSRKVKFELEPKSYR